MGLKAEWWLRLPDGRFLGPVPQDLVGLNELTKRPWWIRGNNGTGLTDFIMTPFGGVAVKMGENALDKVCDRKIRATRSQSILGRNDALLHESHTFRGQFLLFHDSVAP